RGLSHLPTQNLQACPSSRQVQTLKPGKILLAGLELGGDQTDFVDASSAHDVESARDLLELNFLLALHERHLFRARFEDLLDARTQLIPVSVLVVDLELVVFEHLDDNGFVLQFLILLLILVGLRNERVQALGNQRSDDHEDDDQHQQNVDQRDDVRRCERSAGLFSNFHPHCEFSSLGQGLQVQTLKPVWPAAHQACRRSGRAAWETARPQYPANEWWKQPSNYGLNPRADSEGWVSAAEGSDSSR